MRAHGNAVQHERIRECMPPMREHTCSRWEASDIASTVQLRESSAEPYVHPYPALYIGCGAIS